MFGKMWQPRSTKRSPLKLRRHESSLQTVEHQNEPKKTSVHHISHVRHLQPQVHNLGQTDHQKADRERQVQGGFVEICVLGQHVDFRGQKGDLGVILGSNGVNSKFQNFKRGELKSFLGQKQAF